ncbi:hypothetical protein K469DRAFT_548585, partial [Zopfia rhizophila CBS 207.26]
YLKLIKNKTYIFKYKEDRWKSSKLKNKKNILTVIINKKLKEILLGNIIEFLDFKTRI